MIAQMQMTAEEFLVYAEQHPDKHFDFNDGELIEVSPKPLHGTIHNVFNRALDIYNEQYHVGVIYIETLHVLNGEKFIPEVCINEPTDGDYLTAPPLVAVEIRSDSQTRASQRRKAQAYIRHGAKMVILSFPRENVEVYFQGREPLVLTNDDVIDGGDVLPGFKLAVREVV